MNDKKKNVWTIVLTIARYAIAVALGFVSGDSEVVNSLMNM